jgi:hypothetical protein
MTEQTQAQQPAAAQQQDIDLTFKLSFVNALIQSLDEIPHKWSRPIIDALGRAANEQLQGMQQAQQPDGPLGNKVIQ